MQQFGVERLLFGTNFPFQVPWCGTEKVRRAAIPASVRRALMGGNAQRLLALT